MLTQHSGFTVPEGGGAVLKARRDAVTAELMFPGRWWVSDTQERWSLLVAGRVMSATTELRDRGCRGSTGVSLDAVCVHTLAHGLCCLSVMCVGVQKLCLNAGQELR